MEYSSTPSGVIKHGLATQISVVDFPAMKNWNTKAWFLTQLGYMVPICLTICLTIWLLYGYYMVTIWLL